MVALHLLGIVFLTMASRVFPRLIRPWARGSDTYYHLMVAERLRENHFRIPSTLKGFVIPAPYYYPPLFHYLLALFPRNVRDKLEPFLGGICDTLQALALYALVYYLSGQPEFATLQVDRAGIAWMATLVFINCPLLFGVAFGPRTLMGSPRPLTELFTSLALMAGILFYLTAQTGWSLAAIFLFALALLTGKFGLQVLLFFSPVLALFLKSWFFLGLPLFSVAGALVISRGHYWVVLRGHLSHSYFYATTIIHRYTWVRNRGALNFVRIFLRELRQNTRQAFRHLYIDNPYSALLIKNPWLFLWLYLCLLNFRLLWRSDTLFFLLIWVIAGLAAFFLTSSRPFLFLGEAERYIEYTMSALGAMIALILPFGSFRAWWVFGGIMVINAVQLLLNYYVFIRQHSPEQERQTQELLAFLTKKIHGRRAILCVPISYLSYRLAYETLHKPLSFAASSAADQENFKELFDKEVGWPNENLDLILKKYNIDLIVCQLSKMAKAQKLGINYEFQPFPVVFVNQGYIVYQTSNSP